MNADTSQQTALVILSILCAAPFILGLVAGASIQRRLHTHGGWPAAFIPTWLIRWIQDRAK